MRFNYRFIMWAVIGGILLLLLALRITRLRNTEAQKSDQEGQAAYSRGFHSRARGAFFALCRCRPLPESLPSIFGHVTRLQVLVLSVIIVYLLIFS